MTYVLSTAASGGTALVSLSSSGVATALRPIIREEIVSAIASLGLRRISSRSSERQLTERRISSERTRSGTDGGDSGITGNSSPDAAVATAAPEAGRPLSTERALSPGAEILVHDDALHEVRVGSAAVCTAEGVLPGKERRGASS